MHIVVICNSNYFENFSTLFVNPLDRVVFDSITGMGTHIAHYTSHYKNSVRMSEFIALFSSFVPYLIISVLLLKTMISIYISVYITCLHATTPFWVKLVKEHKNTTGISIFPRPCVSWAIGFTVNRTLWENSQCFHDDMAIHSKYT